MMFPASCLDTQCIMMGMLPETCRVALCLLAQIQMQKPRYRKKPSINNHRTTSCFAMMANQPNYDILQPCPSEEVLIFIA